MAYKELEKYREYYNTTLQWLVLKEHGLSIADFLVAYNYKNVAIYGMGDMGNCFYMEIRDSKEINFLYAIDQGFPKLYFDIPCYRLNELNDKEVPDLVVVMLPHIYEDLKQKLTEILPCDIVPINELVYKTMYWRELC